MLRIIQVALDYFHLEKRILMIKYLCIVLLIVSLVLPLPEGADDHPLTGTGQLALPR